MQIALVNLIRTPGESWKRFAKLYDRRPFLSRNQKDVSNGERTTGSIRRLLDKLNTSTLTVVLAGTLEVKYSEKAVKVAKKACTDAEAFTKTNSDPQTRNHLIELLGEKTIRGTGDPHSFLTIYLRECGAAEADLKDVSHVPATTHRQLSLAEEKILREPRLVEGEPLKALSTYARGVEFVQINQALHAGASLSEIEDLPQSKVLLRPLVENLDTALKKSYLPEGTILFRGTKFKYPEETYRKGATFEFKAFMSTSLSAEQAESYARKYGNVNSTLEIIEVPPGGTRGIYVAPFSAYPHEKEVFLPRGLRFEVIDSGSTTSDTAFTKAGTRIRRLRIVP